MEASQFFTASAVTIVAGKGGVGKTTVTAALALAAAMSGLSVLIVEIEGKSGLGRLFGIDRLDYEDVELLAPSAEAPGSIRARTLTPDGALMEYLGDHGLHRISKRLSESGAVDIVATATPGIKDVLILGKVKQIERSREFDVVFVDAPAAGHAITFLRSASGLLDAVSVGPIQTQAAEVAELLADPVRCQVLLVTLPEETPVNEVVETAFSLEDQIGVALAPVVVNAMFSVRRGLDVDIREAAHQAGLELSDERIEQLDDAAQFRRDRMLRQSEEIERLVEALPLKQLTLPFVFKGALGFDDLTVLSAALLNQIEQWETPGDE